MNVGLPPVDGLRSVDTENTILGDVLVRADQFLEYRAAGLKATDFGSFVNQAIWIAMERLVAQAIEPDPLATKKQLTLDGLADVDVFHLINLPDGAPRQASTNIRWMVTQLKELAGCRRLHYAAHDLLDRLGRDQRVTPEAMRCFAEEARGAAATLEPPFHLLDDVTLLARPQSAFLIEGRLVAGGFSFLYSAPGDGKTFISLDLALSIATGTSMVGRPSDDARSCPLRRRRRRWWDRETSAGVERITRSHCNG